jgi:glycopeptide antibiotics resistance protein
MKIRITRRFSKIWIIGGSSACLAIAVRIFVALLGNNRSGFNYPVNYIPFQGYRKTEMLKNLMIPLPISIALSPLIGTKKLTWVVLGILFGLTLETVQFFLGGRIVDVSDVIVNCLGFAVAGLITTSVFSFWSEVE